MILEFCGFTVDYLPFAERQKNTANFSAMKIMCFYEKCFANY